MVGTNLDFYYFRKLLCSSDFLGQWIFKRRFINHSSLFSQFPNYTPWKVSFVEISPVVCETQKILIILTIMTNSQIKLPTNFDRKNIQQNLLLQSVRFSVKLNI